ncbi:hypothetical protein [Pseudoxanthomonas sp. PXM02]|uniref:hypothetical protein n=1 Tax=Pseudoxanthomonas sp. PXM02 TaxID=2769294 RepID=UPI001780A9E7|nr:hypothetical protein [Pseudoxanthomonas sp. PXM02]MBD9477392.1 hypothetical protein [Pseudoxanthomonas sp. PXM02]
MKYEMALEVVRHAENALTGSRVDHSDRWLQGVTDTVLAGPGLVFAGGQLLLWRFFWVMVASAIFAFILRVLEGQPVQDVFLPSFFLAIGVVYFSTPSRSMAIGVDAKRVGEVRNFILSIAHQPQQLQYLGEHIEVVRTHTMQKLGRFNVLAGIAWGVLFWFVGTHALAPGLSAEAVSRGLSYGIVGAVVFTLVLCAGICHATAVRAVCQILEFAMIEAIAEVESASSAPANH